MKHKIICVDLDDTICTENEDHLRCIPREFAVKHLRMLRKENNFIIIHTTRSEREKLLTHNWLTINQIPYDHIKYEKPTADVYVSSKALKFKAWPRCYNQLQGIGEPDPDIIKIYETKLLSEMGKYNLDIDTNFKLRRSMGRARRAVGKV